MNHQLHRLFVALSCVVAPALADRLFAADWQIPLAGNTFRTAPSPGGHAIQRNGGVVWRDPNEVHSVFFHIDRPAALDLSVQSQSQTGRTVLVTRVDKSTFNTVIETGDSKSHQIGSVNIESAGYVRVDLQRTGQDGPGDAELRELLVSSDTDSLTIDYVQSNDGNMFYWGRRGPSVHLRYDVPRNRPIQYAYSEVTVPQGMDPIGSFLMANGFGEGYFGFQVNSPQERRVLFSVWSPFKTDNPHDIPEEQRIFALAKGPEVHIGEFGNEGSGGQSYLVYPWQAGRTYRFLTEVKPTGSGSTLYTSWFGDQTEGRWRLIASFQRPQTDTHLRGFHSFLESFSPDFGFVERRASYGNVWVGDTEGHWHECTRASFSVDATGGRRQRLDFSGGSDGTAFYLRNCGFFDETGRAGETFTRESTGALRPNIQFDSLPR